MMVTSDLRPYPAYKPSGVEWLGDMPAHWEVRRIKTLFRDRDERSDDGRGELLSLTRSRGLIPQTEASNRIASIEDLSNYKICRCGDLVMNRMQAWSGMFAVPSLDGLISPDYCVFGLVCESEVRYFEHLFKTSLLVGQFAQKSKGIGSGFNRLYTDDFGTIPTMVPPVSEQTYIVRFLNHVDRRIRRYIRAKQKLIVLLEEQKRAIIHQAVTGKIDVRTGKPYPAYKDSGVAWLEEVPEHWKESEKIKYLASLKGRLGWQGLKAGEYTSVGPHIVSSAHFSDHKINWGECPRVTQERYERDQNIQLRRGDILLMKDGAAMGKLAFVDGLPGPACLNSHLLLFRPLDFDEEPTYFPQFMFYYMQSECFQGYVQINGTGATFLGISQESVGNHKICLPPHSEQVAIVKHLDKCIAEIDIVIGGTNRKIEFLGEYQARLIAEVVIGKLDVREAAAELPEDVVPSDHDESEAEYTREHPPM